MAVRGRRMGGPLRHLAQRAGEEGGRGAGCRLGAARRAPTQVREAEPHARGDDHRRLADFASLLADPTADRGGARRRGALAGAAGADGHLRPALRPDPRRARVPGPRGPARGRVRRLVRVLPPVHHQTIPHGTAPSVTPSARCPASRRWASTSSTCPRSIRSAEPTARVPTTRSSPSPDDPGSPWAIGNEHGGHTRGESRAGDAGGLPPLRRRPPARSAWRWRSTTRSSARPIIPGCGSTRSGSSSGPTAPSSTPRIRPRSTRTSTRSTSGATIGEALWDACRDVFLFWIEQGVRTFRVDNPHTKPFAFWEWVIGEVHAASIPDVVFLAEAFTRPKRMQDPGAGSGSPSRTPTSPGATRAAELARVPRPS